MVPEDEIVLNLNDAFFVLRVVLFREEQKFGFHCCLVIVLLLVFDKLHCHSLLGFMIKAFEDLAKSAFTDLLYNLESKPYLIAFRDPVVAVCIIVAVVHDPLSLGWVNLVFI